MNNSRHWLRWLGIAIVVAIVGFVLIQFVPVSHANPDVVSEPNWDSPQTRALAQRACFDCHSNETSWPWYAKIAPVSWLVARDVSEGRHTLNFSEWGQQRARTGEIAEVVTDGEMPPWYYSIMHSGAQLSDQEKADLAAGLQATFGR